MSLPVDCREIRHTLGVYVLGAIEPADRAIVDDHLLTCLDCREELASLAGLPALLRRVPMPEAERLALAEPAAHLMDEAPPDDMLSSVVARTARVRRVRRWRELAAAAAVVVVSLGAGVAGGANLLGGSQAPAPAASQGPWHAWQTVSAIDSRTGAVLTVKYATMPWGTTMAVRVAGLRSGTVCQFRVIDAAGHHWVVGGWRVNYQGGPVSVWYPASTSLADSNLRGFEVTAAGKVVARVRAA
jgi:predicted anti-sigma-YlaC factor YlaD